jgi:hypothetical protein
MTIPRVWTSAFRRTVEAEALPAREPFRILRGWAIGILLETAANPAACSEARLSTAEPTRACLFAPGRSASSSTFSTQLAQSGRSSNFHNVRSARTGPALFPVKEKDDQKRGDQFGLPFPLFGVLFF